MRLILNVLYWVVFLPATAVADPLTAGLLAGLGLGAVDLLATSSLYFVGAQIGAFLTTAVGSFLLNAAITVGTMLLSEWLSPKDSGASPGERMVNLRQPIPAREKSYGLVRKGGAVCFWKAKDGARVIVVAINTGEINGYRAHYLDEREVTLGAAGYVEQDEYQSGGGSAVQVQFRTGAAGQTAFSAVSARYSEWTGNHVLSNISAIAMVCENVEQDDFATVYPTGREPVYTGLIEGTKCYDPRDKSTKWTTNAALVMADWVVSPDGLGQEVDWNMVADEADVCDIPVLDRDGNSQPKWQLCGTYSFDQPRESVRGAMALACDAFFFETEGGKVGFRVGRYMQPKYTIRAEHILECQIIEGRDGTEQINAVAVQYLEANAGYREQQSAAFVIDDGEPYSEKTVTAIWAPNHNQAVRVAKRILLAGVTALKVQLKLNLYGLVMGGERFFTLDFPEAGISGVFEVAGHALNGDGLTVTLSGSQVDFDAFEFDAAIEEPAPPAMTPLESSQTIPVPTGVALTSPSVGTLRIDWDAPPRASLLNRIRYREVGTSDWFQVSIPSGQTYHSETGLPTGDDYEAQVRAQTATGYASDWTPTTAPQIEIS